MVEEIRSVMVDGPDGCKLRPVRGQCDVGTVADSVTISGGEVWEIHWRDGTMDLWFHASDS
jgi:hypothetical protein